jgi:hypothetical protein
MMKEGSNKHRAAPEAAMIDVITLLADVIGMFVFSVLMMIISVRN